MQPNNYARQESFLVLAQNALDEAWNLMAGRSGGYNAQTPIPDYFIHGPQDLTYELHKKVTRLDNLLAGGGEETQGAVEDNCLDLIAYAAFLHALLSTQAEDGRP